MTLRIRRGSTPTTPPSEVFGPTAGDQSVRDGAGARPVSDPGGGIAFTSAADLATKITANPNGTVFVAANNIDWDTAVGTGTKAPKIWIPGNRIMNGGGRQIIGLHLGDGGEVHGGVWTNFASVGAQLFHNPIRISGTGAAKVLQDATFHTNWERGFGVAGSNVTVSHCTMHTNGRYGFEANEPSSGVRNTNIRIENCEWYNNNTRNLAMNGQAGGCKLLASVATYVGFCWGHDNIGSGLWFDYNPGAHVVEENVFENNQRWGIFYEVGTGFIADGYSATGTFRQNYLKDNVTNNEGSWGNSTQFLVSCSDGLVNGGTGHEIHHNLIDNTTPRALGFVDHNFHPQDVKGCHIHDNEVYLRSTATALVGGQLDATGTFPQGDPFAAASDNTFEDNHYHVQNTGLAYWRWGGINRTWSQWQALGHDNTGSLEAI